MNSIPRARVLILFPHPIFPVRSGIQLRYAQLVQYLHELNYELVIVGFADSPMVGHHGPYSYLRTHLIQRSSSLDDMVGVCDEFHAICQKEKPDVIINSYIYYDDMIESVAYMGMKRVIDVNDVISKILKDRASIGMSSSYDPSYEKTELETIQKYDSILCISKEYVNKIANARYLPTLPNVLTEANTYNGIPLFTGYKNEFNGHAVSRLLRYLPHLNRPVSVVGSVCEMVEKAEGLLLRGVVDDLGPHYHSAAFSVCPLHYGSGQKVKVLEAMSNGLTVVGFSNQIKEPYIDNHYNSFIVDTDNEFIDYCNHLMSYKTVREEMGRRAKEAALSYFTPNQYKIVLQKALE